MKRASGLQKFLDLMAYDLGISQGFVEASDHPYTCKCEKCKEWWKKMGPNSGTDAYGPFTAEEIEEGEDEPRRTEQNN